MRGVLDGNDIELNPDTEFTVKISPSPSHTHYLFLGEESTHELQIFLYSEDCKSSV